MSAYIEIPLVDICRPKQWKTISSPQLLEDGYPVYGANGKIGFFSEYTHESPTLMITCRGATCGNVHISEPYSYISGNAMALDDLDFDRVDMRYLYHFFIKRGFGDVISGSAQPQITRQGLTKVKIPLPPLPEQRRIAAILDKADAIRRKRQQAIRLTEDFLRSVFLDMFGDPVANPKGWEVKKLSDVCQRVTDGTHQSPKWVTYGIPFLFVSNIVKGQLTFDTQKFISEDSWSDLTRRCPIEVDDILYTTVGSYGNAAMVLDERKFCFQRHIAHIKPDSKKIHPRFLLGQMQSPAIKRQADHEARGVAQKTLNLKELKEFSILTPPLSEQLKFVEIHDGVVKTLEKQLGAFSQQEELFNSLVQRAFRGDL